MRARVVTIVISHVFACSVAFGVGWVLRGGKLELAPAHPPIAPVESGKNETPATAAHDREQMLARTPEPATAQEEIEGRVKQLGKMRDMGRAEFDKYLASTLAKYEGNLLSRVRFRLVAATYMVTGFDDKEAAVKEYKIAAEEATTLVAQASMLRASGFDDLAMNSKDWESAEALDANRRVLHTFQGLTKYPLVGYGLPSRRGYFEVCRQSYIDAALRLVQVAPESIEKDGFLDPVAGRAIYGIRPEFARKLLWLDVHEAEVLLAKRRLLILDSLYPADNPEEKRRVSETLQAAVKLLEAHAREKSDKNFAEIQKPTAKEVRERARRGEFQIEPK